MLVFYQNMGLIKIHSIFYIIYQWLPNYRFDKIWVVSILQPWPVLASQNFFPILSCEEVEREWAKRAEEMVWPQLTQVSSHSFNFKVFLLSSSCYCSAPKLLRYPGEVLRELAVVSQSSTWAIVKTSSIFII